MSERHPFYLFRGGPFFHGPNTVYGAAPRDLVVSVYGGGGLKGERGLISAFGGALVFRNAEAGTFYLGVWRARNVSKFRNALRRSATVLDVIHHPPPARLMFSCAEDRRASRLS